MALQKEIERIREALRRGQFTTEASVSHGIVLPILNVLGWPVFDMAVVIPEYSLEGRRVDYALCHPQDKPVVFIEVKKVGSSEGADRQLFEYAFHVGVPVAILTDGQEWSFYLPGEQGQYYERQVYKLDLLEREASEATDRLWKYLSYERTCSGEALKAARSDYQDIARHREIESTLPKAWQALLKEQDSLLLDLLAEKVEDLCGYKPNLDACSRFLISVQSSSQDTTIELQPRPQKKKKTIRRSRRTRREFTFSFKGRTYKASSAREVMVCIFQLFAQEDDRFLECFAVRKHGKRRRYLARERMELYPGRPDLAEEAAMEIMPGWWIGTNYNRKSIQKIIELAREVAGPMGSQLDVRVDK